MKKLLFLLAFAPLIAAASGPAVKLDKAPIDTTNLPSLQRGAQIFVNYCLNCHSAGYMRYNRMRDLGLTDQQIRDNLMFAGEKVGDTMTIAMRPKDAAGWFGAAPPDLTVISRSRGADWLYTYLRTFHRDASRPTGWNNVAFPNVGMPHVLYELDGMRTLTVEEVFEGRDEKTGASTGFAKRTIVYDTTGHRTEKVEKLEGHGLHASTSYKWDEGTKGVLSRVEYDAAVGDLVNFLEYMGEPSRDARVRLGIYVMLFLVVLILVSWLLKRAYWKDIH